MSQQIQQTLSSKASQEQSQADKEESKQTQVENQQKKTSTQEQNYDQIFCPKLDVREPTYQGLWYSSQDYELNIQLNVWLDMAKCDITSIKSIKAIIAPHAGFSFSGPTAAWAYRYLKQNPPTQKLRVFVLGPFHYIFIRSCALSGMKTYETPLGNIEIDQETIQQLLKEGSFEVSDKDAEEEEHSIEMQLCFLIKTLGLENIKLIPVMVGSIDSTQEEKYGKLFSKYINQEDTLFVISTDFCHWGQKFKYTYSTKEDCEIYEQIEKLDQKGMEHIEMNDIDAFQQYIRETENNICGRHAISILMNAIAKSKISNQIDTKFIRYSQSSLVRDKNDSSVSYAAAVSIITE
ncbi:AmmeMemoRadiSam system protein B (macronuclear) [Tetrahymena thermophila SB210]|uniref:AmmeMemoRadiSam system protein B n=1 Tax=Tetrahymena thermophila (strain SB210) TaxID=312017 RepID=I7ML70_TETTS|nr:AmmeMemoRadiSam system protein B [Tetrahymena thermophila SB210]EAS01287.2 AmmeMemoRadiSam system protein B [Tetrahymena thermophila SB210]|eukprot:XP_001021532.2 AmmeMemoRadiSam system protein B [Tetrahymena thermophila SB210]